MQKETIERYGSAGIDPEKAIERVASIPISLHIWQIDDIRGFEKGSAAASGGIQTTGNYPYRARNVEEVMADMSYALTLIPGKKRVDLHSSYYVTSRKGVDRDSIRPEDYAAWVDWARERNLGLDLNPTCFSHPMVKDNATLSSHDEKVRSFWVRHCRLSREVSSYFAKELGGYSLCNLWIPDGAKDYPADRLAPRMRLAKSLDEIYDAPLPGVIDSIESKLFGIGLEAYTVGSSEFYLAYAAKHPGICPLIDMGHYHPTEDVYDKISALLPFFPYLPIHVTRPMRWDSDHVVRLDDQLQNMMDTIISLDADKKVLIGLDYFDASINRVIALVTGARNVEKALLRAALTPWKKLKEDQEREDYSALLADEEAAKTLPWSDVWNEYLSRQGIPAEDEWLAQAKSYEKNVLAKRD